MKRGWVWVALLLSVGINIGVLAMIGVSRMRTEARWEQQPREGDRPPPFERLARYLEVEGEQREEFMEIQQRLFRTTRQSQETLESLRRDLRLEVMSESPDPVRVDQLLAEIGSQHRDLDRALVESVLATRKVLSPEQQRRYFHVLERMRDASRRFGDRQGGPPRRPGSGRRPPPQDKP